MNHVDAIIIVAGFFLCILSLSCWLYKEFSMIDRKLNKEEPEVKEQSFKSISIPWAFFKEPDNSIPDFTEDKFALDFTPEVIIKATKYQNPSEPSKKNSLLLRFILRECISLRDKWDICCYNESVYFIFENQVEAYKVFNKLAPNGETDFNGDTKIFFIDLTLKK